MAVLLFHDIFFHSYIANLLLFGIFLIGWITSLWLIYEGVRFSLNSKIKLWILGTVLLLPIIGIFFGYTSWATLFTFPFGFFAGFLLVFIFDTRVITTYQALVYLGTVVNIVGILGLIGVLKRRFK